MHFDSPIRHWFGYLSSRKSTTGSRKDSKRQSDFTHLSSLRRKPQRADTASLFAFSTTDDPGHKSEVIRDSEYYLSDDDPHAKFCVLRVKNRLFRVHKSVLERDNSAFSKVFKFHPSQADNMDDNDPICLYDNVEQFRDLLRVLYCFPTELPRLDIDGSNRHKLPRLLNVAELALKYRFSSFESWAIQHINLVVSDESFSLTDGQPHDIDDETMARILEVSIAGDHTSLLDVIVKKIITEVLWNDLFPGIRLLEVVERHALQRSEVHRLLGVLYYRMLVNLETTSASPPQPIFPPLMNLEKRMRFLSAYQTLGAVWKRLCSSPPPLPAQDDDITLSDFPIHAPDIHASCMTGWNQMWLQTSQRVNRSSGHCPAAVLANLKQMMLILRKETTDSRMCIQCSMDSLEAIALIRDQVIESLGDMFIYCQ